MPRTPRQNALAYLDFLRADLLARHLTKSTTPEENDAVVAYLAAHPEEAEQLEALRNQPDPERPLPAPTHFVTETITDTAPTKKTPVAPSLPLGEGGRGGEVRSGGEVIFRATGSYPLAQLVGRSFLQGGNQSQAVKQDAALFVEAEQAGLYATLTLRNNPETFGRDLIFCAVPKTPDVIGQSLVATVTAGDRVLWSEERRFDDYTLWEALLPTKGIENKTELTLTIERVGTV